MSNPPPPRAEDDAPLVEPTQAQGARDLGSLDTERILRETGSIAFPPVEEEQEPAHVAAAAGPEPLAPSDAPALSGTNVLAVISLVLALALSPFAVVFGYLAVGQARRSHQKGETVAWVAVGLGWVWVMGYVILGSILGAAWLQVS